MTVGNAVKYGAAGAAAGSVLGPWGTAAGGIIGGIGGLLTGNGSSSHGPTANPANYQLGQGNGTDYSNQIAGALANRGNAADATAALQQSQAQGAYGAAANAQNISAPQIQQDFADRQRQLAALGGTNTAAGQLQGTAGQLQQLGANGLPMGLAAAQLQQGENANMNQALALAHSGRSLGGGAAALQAAQFQNAQTGQVTNQQAAQANIQEQQQNQQFKLGAFGAAQQGFGSAGSLYGQAGTQAAGVNQTDLGVQQTNAQLIQGQQGINNQTSSTFGQIGAGLNQSALGQQTLGQGYQGQGLNTLNSQLNANENYSGATLGQSNANRAADTADNTQTLATIAAGAQGAAQLLRPGASGGGTASDRDAKTGIQPANMALSLQPRLAALSPPALATPSSLARPVAGPAAPLSQSLPASLPVPAPLARPAAGQLAPLGQVVGASGSRLAPYDPNAMPSGTPHRAAAPTAGAPGMADSLGQLSGVGTVANIGPSAGPEHSDPYLGAIAGTGSMYLPGGYVDPKLAAYQQATAPKTDTLYDKRRRDLFSSLSSMSDGEPAPAPAPAPTPVLLGIGQQPDNYRASDAHSKARIEQLEGQLAALSPRPQAPDTDALDAAYRSQGGTPITSEPAVDLRAAQGYQYQYKDPERHGQGTFYGPMAQDLEQSPAGASTVKQAPDGTKMVDTSRLSLVNTAAISEQQRKLQQLQSQLAALSQPQMDAIQSGFPASYPTPQQPGSIDFSQAMARGGAY